MWTLSLLAHLASQDADAKPLPTVTVRPLPAIVRPVVVGTPSKADLIAAAYVEYTVVHTTMGKVPGEDGGRLPFPAVFTCVVSEHVLTVSYTREGLDASQLPAVGSCGTGDEALQFRIVIEPPTVPA
ncbi:MAG: hypothetical protein V4850_24650 [Myxococcota bacterium]